jgi:hypothetical protein
LSAAARRNLNDRAQSPDRADAVRADGEAYRTCHRHLRIAGGYMLAHLLEQGGWDLSWHRKWWMKRWRKPERLAAPTTQRFSRRLSVWMGLDPNHRDCAE